MQEEKKNGKSKIDIDFQFSRTIFTREIFFLDLFFLI